MGCANCSAAKAMLESKPKVTYKTRIITDEIIEKYKDFGSMAPIVVVKKDGQDCGEWAWCGLNIENINLLKKLVKQEVTFSDIVD